MPLLIATLAVALNAGSALANTYEQTSDVVGGTAAPAHKWPDAVAVLGTKGSCTGTLIAPDVVLTAGHCAGADLTRVVADTTDYNAAGGKSATIKSVTAYPNWATTYDIAVVVLNAPITGVNPRPIGTSCSFDSFHANMDVHLVGFGATDAAGATANTVLREASAPVVDADCMGSEGCTAAVAPGGEFVAGGNGKDSCFGDSGGPVYLDTPRGTIVIAAVSRGVDGAATACGGGGIYVRTDKVMHWIEQTTGRTIAKDSCYTGADDGGSGAPGSTDTDTGSGSDREQGSAPAGGGCSSTGTGSASLGFGVLLVGIAALCRRR